MLSLWLLLLYRFEIMKKRPLSAMRTSVCWSVFSQNWLFYFREAIEHFLIALNLQKNNRGLKDEKSAMSTTIWLSLQMAISYHGLENLGVDINQRDLDQLNKIFGIVT